jgi:3-phosphoshikimate 1-carboxyvinyltransferase
MNLVLKKRQPAPAATEIILPASKSISNRLLIMQFLSNNRIKIENLSKADDTKLMQHLLDKISQHNSDGFQHETLTLSCDNAGTVFRFLTALLSVQPGSWLLTGSERMKKRPVAPLYDALNQLGASIEYCSEKGFPPLKIQGGNLKEKKISIDGSESSQYVSALLMIAPLLPGGLHLTLEGKCTSRPYIDMTLALMQEAGIHLKEKKNTITVKPGDYQPTKFTAEPDWSSASYWYEMAALMPGTEILLRRLSLKSLQGDAELAIIFSSLGVASYETGQGILIKRIEDSAAFAAIQEPLWFNLSQQPDLAPALAATCAALNIKAKLSGLGNLKIKESNRLEALHDELRKINPTVRIVGDDELLIGKHELSIDSKACFFSTCNDHRMAMALAPLALCCRQVEIEAPDVVAKSYPHFWEDLEMFFDLSF